MLTAGSPQGAGTRNTKDKNGILKKQLFPTYFQGETGTAYSSDAREAGYDPYTRRAR